MQAGRGGLGAIIFAAMLLPLPNAALAQEGAPVAPLSVMVLDQDRLFAESAFGQRINADLSRLGERLSAQNRRIEAELSAEERRLTQDRATLTPEAFAAEADAFDARVEAARAAQDSKNRALADYAEAARARFFAEAGPVLIALLGESGAVAILDRRAVIFALDSFDMTARAVTALDAALGDGQAGPLSDLTLPDLDLD